MADLKETQEPPGIYFKGLGLASGTLHFIVSIAIIAALSYILGRQLLVGPIGNDGPHQLSYVIWLSKYLPDLPNWFPLAGGGYSAGRAYPLFSFYLLSIASRVTGLSNIEVFHLGAFIATLISAIGIYAVCWTVLNNRTLGLIASVLYLLSPISWFHAYEHGFIASILATAPIPFAFICFDQYYRCRIDGTKGAKSRIWFASFVLLSALAIMLHLVVGAAIGLIVALYVMFTVVFSQNARRRNAWRAGLISLLSSAVVLVPLLAFWLVPLYVYSGAVGQGLRVTPEMVAQHKQYLDELISITPAGTTKWATNASFPLVIAALAAIGGLFGWIYSRKGFVLTLIGIIALLFLASTEIKVAASYLGPFAAYFFGERTLLVTATLFIPIGAAVGVWTLGTILTYPIRIITRPLLERPAPLSGLLTFVGGIGASATSLAIAALFLYAFRSVSSADPEYLDIGGVSTVQHEYLNFGLERLRGIDVHDVWKSGSSNERFWDQLLPERWPPLVVAGEDESLEEARRVLSQIPNHQGVRIDISPYIGRLAQNMVVLSDISQMAIYTVSADLMRSVHGYYGNAMFSREPAGVEYGTPNVINELAEWFGIQYVFIQPELDPTEHYVEGGWIRIAEDQYGGMPIELWSPPVTNELATLTSRPRILVIGREDINSYESVFRIGTRGAIPYQESMLVESGDPVDEHSLEELARFDALVLHGYTYEDSGKAWSLLEQYVTQGGSLYVDTGWQWTVPEWEFEEAPTILPVSRLSWTNYGVTDDFLVEAPEIGGAADPALFSPLVWEGQPWEISGPSRDDVRIWGQVVLSVAGQPLIVAGEYGQGRVIWSGMNLIAHAMDKNNEEEVDLLHSMVAWLLADVGGSDYRVVVERNHPDHVTFQGEVPAGGSAALYWREAYYPAWHAYLIDSEGDRQELPIYRGGPGFMLIPLESDNAAFEVELTWETPITERLAALVSLLAAGAFLGYVIDGEFFERKAFKRFGGRLRRRRSRSRPQGYVEWLEDTSWNDLEKVPSDHVEPNSNVSQNAAREKSETNSADGGRNMNERIPETIKTKGST